MIKNMYITYCLGIVLMRYIRYEKNYLWFPMEGEILEFNVAANINAIFLAIMFDFIFQNNTSEKLDFCLTFFRRFPFILVWSLLWEVM